jgi:phosphopantothenate synthetase
MTCDRARIVGSRRGGTRTELRPSGHLCDRTRSGAWAVGFAWLLILGWPPVAAATVELVTTAALQSHTPGGGAEISTRSVSGDGRFVVFASAGPSVVTGQVDANITSDVYLWDRLTGVTALVSRAAGTVTTTGNGASDSPVISTDGAFIAYRSRATNLIAGQVGAGLNVFLFDRVAGTTMLVSRAGGSVTTTGNSTSDIPVLSADGRFVAYRSFATNLVLGQSDANGNTDVFLFDRVAGTTVLVSRATGSTTTTGNGVSDGAAISSDGTFVAYRSAATNLISGQTDTNGTSDVFVFNRVSGTTTLVSRVAGTVTTAGNSASDTPVISADGGFVAYRSFATNLVAGQSDVNGTTDVFLFNRVAGTTTLVSRLTGTTTTTGNSASDSPVISADGGFVAYRSVATNLVAGQSDANATADVFLFNRAAGTTTLVSRLAGATTTTGNNASDTPVISADGGFVAYRSFATNVVAGQSDTNLASDVFLFDRAAGATTLVSRAVGTATTTGNSGSDTPVITSDGSFVAYRSSATNLIAGPMDLNAATDVFVFDRTASGSVLVSAVQGDASETPFGDSSNGRVSADGRYVVFTSTAAGVVPGQVDSNSSSDVFLFDRVARTTTVVSRAAGTVTTTGNAGSDQPVISADGAFIAYRSSATDLVAGQGAGGGNVFLFDRMAGTTTLVSRAAGTVATPGNGGSSAPAISADGAVVVYVSSASDLVTGQTDTNVATDVFLFDRVAATTTLVSRVAGTGATAGNGVSDSPVISADGAFVAYRSFATNLVSGLANTNSGADVFLFERVTGATTLVSRAAGTVTTTGNNTADQPVISADGAFVAYRSFATNVVAQQSDANANTDVFLFDRVAGTTILLSRAVGTVATTGNGFADTPVISADGAFVAFRSRATNLVVGQIDSNGNADIFLFDRMAGITTLVSRAAGTLTTTVNANGADTPLISGDGAFIAYRSSATNILAGQSGSGANAIEFNVFLFDRLAGGTVLASHVFGTTTTTGNGSSVPLAISGDGAVVLFSSLADNLVVHDGNANRDLFVFVREAEVVTADADTYSVDQNTLLMVGAPGVLGNDTGTGLTASLVDGPQHGALSLNPDGGFTYAPTTGFHGADTFTYRAVNTFGVSSEPATVLIEVRVVQVTPVVTWPTPADITYPAPLGAAELDATADVPGTFEYTPAAGTVLDAGAGQTLAVTFTPADTVQYTTASATVAINVLKAPTSVAVTSSKNPSTAGEALTFTATVSGGVGASGTIAFTVDGGPLACPGGASRTDSVATCTTSALTAGTRAIAAAFSGATNFADSTGTLAGGQLVKAATTITVTSSVNPSTFGELVTFTAVMSGGGDNSGTVTFKADGSPLNCNGGSGRSGSVANCRSSVLAVGSHVITVEFRNSPGFGDGDGTLAGGQTVVKRATVTTVAASGVLGGPVVLTASVAGSGVGGGNPGADGQITFRVNGTAIVGCTSLPLASSQATCTTTAYSAGSQLVTAEYRNGTNFLDSDGTLVRTAVSVTVTSNIDPSTFGEVVTYRAQLSGATLNAGTLVFKADGAPLNCNAGSSGGGPSTLATCNSSVLTAGTHVVTAEFTGSAAFLDATGTLAGGQVVHRRATITTVSAGGVLGGPVTLVAAVTGTGAGGGNPGTDGQLTFRVNGVAVAGCTLLAVSASQATCITSAYNAGSQVVTAEYRNGANFVESDGMLVRTPATITVAATPNPSNVGDLVTFTATLSVTLNNGTLVFKADGAPLNCNGGSSGGGPSILATCRSSVLSAGSHVITAEFTNSAAFLDSVGTLSGGQTVNALPTATSVVSSRNPSTFGETVTFTATVTGPNGSPGNDGQVVFMASGAVIAGCGAVPLVVGQAACTTAALHATAPAAHAVQAEYGSAVNFLPSTGVLAGGQTVHPVTVAVAISGGPFVFDGSPHAATVVVTPTAPHTVTYTGTATAYSASAPPTAADIYTVTVTLTDPNYALATPATGTLVVQRAPQAITFDALTGKTWGDADFEVSASATSGLPVVFVAAGNCEIVGTAIVHLTGAGSCTVTARQPGDADHEAAPDVARSFVIARAAATLTLGTTVFVYDGTPKAVAVTTDPPGLTGVTVTYDGAATPPSSAGSHAVTASLAHPDYQAATVTGTLLILLADAGTDQSVDEGIHVTLNGSASFGLAYTWTQIAGEPVVTLDGADSATATFVAPPLDGGFGSTVLTFRLVATDGFLEMTDTVDITVKNVNHAPVPEPGNNQTVSEGSVVTLSGSASYDPDGDPIVAYQWTQTGGPAVALTGAVTPTAAFTAPFLPGGVTGTETLTFTLTVSDGVLAATSQEVSVTVNQLNNPPTAAAGANQTVNVNTLVTLGATGQDPDGDALAFTWTQTAGAPVTLSDVHAASPTFVAPATAAVLTFEVVASDGLAASAPVSVTVTVVNPIVPPACQAAHASPALLWPPNHKMVPVSIVGVSDPQNYAVTITVTGVTQDEPTSGLGDGDTPGDAVLSGGQLLLRAERGGAGNGRVYRITFLADNGNGGTCTGAVTVGVPRDQGRNGTPIDSGQSFSSMP